MEETLFRQKSIDRITSPEQLNDYLHVTTPAVWVALAAVIILLLTLLTWSSGTAIESFAAGTARVENGILSLTFDDQAKAERVKAGMEVKVGAMKTTILTVGKNQDGEPFALARIGIPDGTYEARVGYDYTEIISLLFN